MHLQVLRFSHTSKVVLERQKSQKSNGNEQESLEASKSVGVCSPTSTPPKQGFSTLNQRALMFCVLDTQSGLSAEGQGATDV